MRKLWSICRAPEMQALGDFQKGRRPAMQCPSASGLQKPAQIVLMRPSF